MKLSISLRPAWSLMLPCSFPPAFFDTCYVVAGDGWNTGIFSRPLCTWHTIRLSFFCCNFIERNLGSYVWSRGKAAFKFKSTRTEIFSGEFVSARIDRMVLTNVRIKCLCDKYCTHYRDAIILCFVSFFFSSLPFSLHCCAQFAAGDLNHFQRAALTFNAGYFCIVLYCRLDNSFAFIWRTRYFFPNFSATRWVFLT